MQVAAGRSHLYDVIGDPKTYEASGRNVVSTSPSATEAYGIPRRITLPRKRDCTAGTVGYTYATNCQCHQ